MTKTQEFFEKSQRINNDIWDIMVAQVIEFSRGKTLDASYDSNKLTELKDELCTLQNEIRKLYGSTPASLDEFYAASLKMIDDIVNGTLLLSETKE